MLFMFRPSGLNGFIVLLVELSFLLCFNPNWSPTKVSLLISVILNGFTEHNPP